MNRRYKYGKSSMLNISTLAKPLQDICHEALAIANTRALHCPDIAITCGIRTAIEQNTLYLQGRRFTNGKYVKVGQTVTNCDGYKLISDHQKTDATGGSLALDFCAYISGAANYSDENMALIATCFFEAASNQGHEIDWGGSYRSISDGSHISLILSH